MMPVVREKGTIGLNGCLDQLNASALSQSFPKLSSGPFPTTEVLLAWINRDGECGSQEVRPSLAGQWLVSFPLLYRRRAVEK